MGTLQLLLPFIAIPILALYRAMTAKHIPALYYPASPLRFKVKKQHTANGNGAANGKTANGYGTSGETESVSIKTFLETRVPSLFKGYTPTWWLPSGHLQTLYVVAGDFTKVDKVVYERTLIQCPDGGTLGLDMTPPTKDSPDLPPETPIIVVQHGLTGGSYESYVRSILAGACAPKSEGGLGFRAIVINFRGCANVPVTSPQFYSAGHTEDLRCGLLYISEKYPNAPLIGMGFSLGANVMTRYLGEEGEKSRLRAGVVLACPWDVTKNSKRLEEEFIPKTFYSKALGGNLMALFTGHMDTIRKLPEDERLTPQIANILSLKNPTLKEVDQALTRFVGGSAPPFPFESADHYYEWACSHKHLHTIRVPFLALNAADDPIVGFNPTDETEHSTTCALAITPYGGHLGWFHGGGFLGRGGPPDRWVRVPVLEWLRAVGEDYIPDSKLGQPKNGRDRIERDGFILEKGKDLVGFKVVEEGSLVFGEDDTSNKNLVKGL